MNICKTFEIAKILLITACCFVRLGNSQKNEFSDWMSDRSSNPNTDLDNFISKPLCSLANSLDGCDDDKDAFMYHLLLKKRKEHSSALSKVFAKNKMVKFLRSPPTLLNRGFSCSCVMESYLHHFGIGYFPSSVLTMKCKPGSCFGGPYQCRPKEYKIQVLKQKDLDDPDREENSSGIAPNSLKDLFTTENFTVIVACECVP